MKTITNNPSICLEILQKNIHLCDEYEKTFIENMSKKTKIQIIQLNDRQKAFLIKKAHEIAFMACLEK